MIAIGSTRFEHDLVVVCNCRKVEVAPSTLNLTGMRVLLRWNGREEQGHFNEFEGTCRVCGTVYRVQMDVAFKRGEVYEAEQEALLAVAEADRA